jgi:hypothetical protein
MLKLRVLGQGDVHADILGSRALAAFFAGFPGFDALRISLAVSITARTILS